MRAWISLVLLVSMISVGCGDSDEKESTDGETNGPDNSAVTGGENSDAGPEDPWQDCDREMTEKEIQGYTGPMPTFSQADGDRCLEVCMNQSEDCYSDKNCPGIEVWEMCLNRNAFACSVSEGKACRTEYENVECCGGASGCKELSCVEQKCPAEASALRDCRAADKACGVSARSACFGAGAGTPD